MDLTQDLRDEHESILAMLDILEAYAAKAEHGGQADTGDAGAMVEFIRGFADRLHHGKEEDLLFPAMEVAGVPKKQGPIGVMLSEHGAGREHVARMAGAIREHPDGGSEFAAVFVPAARGYVELLRHHIAKENMVLFPMAERVLDKRTKAELAELFAGVEAERMGDGGREEIAALIDRLGKRYLDK